MTNFSQDYSSSKAPGAGFAIVLTVAVNIALFAILAWVNKRDIVREPVTPTIIARHTYSMPKPLKERKPVKKNIIKPKAKKTVQKAKSRSSKPKPTRPKPRASTPTLPSIRASMPSMTLNLQGNLALPMHTGEPSLEPSSEPSGGSSNIASNDGVDQPARAIYQPQPVYPLSAKRLGHTGSALVELTISTSGLPADARVVTSSGHQSLDKSALRALRSWRFSPAVDNGEKVPVRGTITITFNLDR